MMMVVYDRFIKVHDYLHKNIHCLSGIYKLFYGGFIQATQALITAKHVKLDPTKGLWWEHELLVMKIY